MKFEQFPLRGQPNLHGKSKLAAFLPCTFEIVFMSQRFRRLYGVNGLYAVSQLCKREVLCSVMTQDSEGVLSGCPWSIASVLTQYSRSIVDILLAEQAWSIAGAPTECSSSIYRILLVHPQSFASIRAGSSAGFRQCYRRIYP